jgi:hypothetical protein
MQDVDDRATAEEVGPHAREGNVAEDGDQMQSTFTSVEGTRCDV